MLSETAKKDTQKSKSSQIKKKKNTKNTDIKQQR